MYLYTRSAEVALSVIFYGVPIIDAYVLSMCTLHGHRPSIMGREKSEETKKKNNEIKIRRTQGRPPRVLRKVVHTTIILSLSCARCPISDAYGCKIICSE